MPGTPPTPATAPRAGVALSDARGRLGWVLLGWVGRLSVAGLFIYAAVMKIAAPPEFAKDIRAYELFPAAVTNIMAYTVPWIEVAAAGLLVLNIWRREARLLIVLMLVAFTLLKGYALATGSDLDCGCFGDSIIARFSSGVSGIWFNLGLLAGCAVDWYGARRAKPRAAPAPAD